MIKQFRRASKKFICIECCYVIFVKCLEDLANLTVVLENIGLEYIDHQLYNNDDGTYRIELRMTYSDSVRMNKGLNTRGYELKDGSKLGIIKFLQKEEIEEL